MVKGKTSMGRQKIEMKKIESEEARLVCFSKRRAGMFKKAAELSILCGAMVAVVAFSPSGRPFSFGSPSFKAVYNRFSSLIGPAISGENSDNSSGETNTTQEALECSELEQSIEDEKKREKRLDETIIERDIDARVMDLLTTEVYSSGLDDLQEFHKKLVAIQDIVKEKIKQVLQEGRHPAQPYPPAFIDLVSKYMVDVQIATPALNSNRAVADGLGVNCPSTSGAHDVGASVNYPNDQLDG